MAITTRCYLFEEGGSVRRIPRRVVEGLIFGNDAMPEYANSVQRIGTAVIENENGKPLRIVDSRALIGPSMKKERSTKALASRLLK